MTQTQTTAQIIAEAMQPAGTRKPIYDLRLTNPMAIQNAARRAVAAAAILDRIDTDNPNEAAAVKQLSEALAELETAASLLSPDEFGDYEGEPYTAAAHAQADIESIARDLSAGIAQPSRRMVNAEQAITAAGLDWLTFWQADSERPVDERRLQAIGGVYYIDAADIPGPEDDDDPPPTDPAGGSSPSERSATSTPSRAQPKHRQRLSRAARQVRRDKTTYRVGCACGWSFPHPALGRHTADRVYADHIAADSPEDDPPPQQPKPAQPKQTKPPSRRPECPECGYPMTSSHSLILGRRIRFIENAPECDRCRSTAYIERVIAGSSRYSLDAVMTAVGVSVDAELLADVIAALDEDDEDRFWRRTDRRWKDPRTPAAKRVSRIAAIIEQRQHEQEQADLDDDRPDPDDDPPTSPPPAPAPTATDDDSPQCPDCGSSNIGRGSITGDPFCRECQSSAIAGADGVWAGVSRQLAGELRRSSRPRIAATAPIETTAVALDDAPAVWQPQLPQQQQTKPPAPPASQPADIDAIADSLDAAAARALREHPIIAARPPLAAVAVEAQRIADYARALPQQNSRYARRWYLDAIDRAAPRVSAAAQRMADDAG